MTKTKQAKFLNLQKLDDGAERVLQIGGKEYPIVEMTVKNFLETSRVAAELGDEATMGEQIEATIGMILRSVPTLKRELLEDLSMTKLARITAFVRGDDIEEEPAAEPVEGEAGKV